MKNEIQSISCGYTNNNNNNRIICHDAEREFAKKWPFKPVDIYIYAVVLYKRIDENAYTLDFKPNGIGVAICLIAYTRQTTHKTFRQVCVCVCVFENMWPISI